MDRRFLLQAIPALGLGPFVFSGKEDPIQISGPSEFCVVPGDLRLAFIKMQEFIAKHPDKEIVAGKNTISFSVTDDDGVLYVWQLPRERQALEKLVTPMVEQMPIFSGDDELSRFLTILETEESRRQSINKHVGLLCQSLESYERRKFIAEIVTQNGRRGTGLA